MCQIIQGRSFCVLSSFILNVNMNCFISQLFYNEKQGVFWFFFFCFFLKILCIYLTEIETPSESGNTSMGSGRGRSRLRAEEPDVGLDSTTPGSRPEPKADA